MCLNCTTVHENRPRTMQARVYVDGRVKIAFGPARAVIGQLALAHSAYPLHGALIHFAEPGGQFAIVTADTLSFMGLFRDYSLDSEELFAQKIDAFVSTLDWHDSSANDIYLCDFCNEYFVYRRATTPDCCPSCEDSLYRCEGCECLMHADDTYSDGHGRFDGVFCRDCYDQQIEAWEESERERLEEEESANSAAHDSLQALLKSHSYKPTPNFFASDSRDNFFVGMELEVMPGDELDEDMVAALKNVRTSGRFYLKEDGSLGAGGAEIVSHPHTVPELVKELAGISRLSASGWRSHEAECCGLHFHVDRRALSKCAILKLSLFFARNAKKTLEISRRRALDLQRWADLDERSVTASVYGGANRYKALNTVPSKTVEFRLFRGTLKLETLTASLCFVRTVCAWAEQTSFKALAWEDYAAWARDNYKRFIPKSAFKVFTSWLGAL